MARQAVAARYTAGLAGLPLVLPAERPGATHVFHQYTIRTHRRDALAPRIWRPPASAPPATTRCPSRPSRCSAISATTPTSFPAAWAAARRGALASVLP